MDDEVTLTLSRHTAELLFEAAPPEVRSGDAPPETRELYDALRDALAAPARRQ